MRYKIIVDALWTVLNNYHSNLVGTEQLLYAGSVLCGDPAVITLFNNSKHYVRLKLEFSN